MNIGEVIVNLRKQEKVKQKDLAKTLGISVTYLSLVENNEYKPSISLLAKIANHFDLPLSSIFFKALNIDEIKGKKQKEYFEAAKPIVDSLIEYLLSGENKAKGIDPLPEIKPKLQRRAKA